MNQARAKKTAQQEFSKILERRKDWAKVSFLPLRLKYETESFWVFYAASPELQERGIVPGAIFFTIDKKDGHCWSNTEIEDYNLAKVPAPELQTV